MSVAAEVEDRPGLMGAVAVGRLHELKMAVGVGHLAELGLGWEAKGQSESLGVEGLEQMDQSLAGVAGVPVCQVEEVEVQQLRCSPPSSPPPSLLTAR